MVIEPIIKIIIIQFHSVMLQVNFLRENKERILQGLQKRNFKQLDLVDEAISADDERKKFQFELDQNLAEMNKISKEIGILMKDGKKKKQRQLNLKLQNIKKTRKTFSKN